MLAIMVRTLQTPNQVDFYPGEERWGTKARKSFPVGQGTAELEDSEAQHGF